MLVVLAKLGSPTIVGQFVLGTAISAPIFLLTNLHLRGAQATDVRGEYSFNDYLGLRIAATAIALIGVCGIVYYADYSLQTSLVVLLIAIGRGLDAISDIIYGMYQSREQMEQIARPMILNGLISMFFLTLLMVMTGSVVCAVAGWTLASALTLVYNLTTARGYLKSPLPANKSIANFRTFFGSRPRKLVQLASLALPLGVTTMLGSLTANIPRYFIEHELGTKELGIFAAMAYILFSGTTIVSALGQAASPRLARYYSSGNHDAFRNLLQELIGLGAIGGLIGFVAAAIGGQKILSLLYSPEYAHNVDTFLWLTSAASFIFVGSFLGYGLTSIRCFRPQVPLTAASALVLTAGCALLIPRYGLNGAAVATGLAAICQMVGCGYVLYHVLDEDL